MRVTLSFRSGGCDIDVRRVGLSVHKALDRNP
jgi:hypothetical protein